jgi:tetratricopeptide (TPR) repeat protein
MRLFKLLAAAFACTLLCSQPAAAGADLDARVKAPPKDAEGMLDLGRALRRAGKFDQAVRVLRRAYAKAGRGPTAIQVRLEAARSLIDAGQQKQAVRECTALKAVSPEYQWVCAAEAHLLWKRASLALPLAEKALAKDANNYDALVAKGRALSQMGKKPQAEAEYRKAIGADARRYEAYLRLGELLGGSAGRVQIGKANQVAPDEPEPLLALGTALEASAAATTALERAIALRPGFGAAHARLGVVKHRLGDVPGAETALRRALAIDGKKADWHAALAAVLVAKKYAKAALAEADLALKLVSNHAGAKLARANALAQSGEIDLAIEAYEQAHGFARTDPEPLLHAARACLSHNRPTTARAFADRVTQDFADYAPGWVVLGEVQRAAGERAAAKAAFRKALSAKRGRIDRAAVQKQLQTLR